MTRAWLRMAELVVYALVTFGLIGLAAYMISLGRTGEAFGAVVGTIPVMIQAIGRVGQAQAMMNLADHLANSTPANGKEE